MVRHVLLSMMVFVSAAAHAQQLDLTNGSWVRVRARTLSSQHEAQVAALTSDSISLALDIGGPPLPLAIRDLSLLQVWREAPHPKRRAITGLVIGASLGTIAGVLFQTSCETSSTLGPTGPCGNLGPIDRALIGAASGSAIGLLMGSVLRRGRWEPVIDR
ncbi:MAG: hypothetical protein ACRENU_02165 [Gemmatimonadaceae bacterium]